MRICHVYRQLSDLSQQYPNSFYCPKLKESERSWKHVLKVYCLCSQLKVFLFCFFIIRSLSAQFFYFFAHSISGLAKISCRRICDIVIQENGRWRVQSLKILLKASLHRISDLLTLVSLYYCIILFAVNQANGVYFTSSRNYNLFVIVKKNIRRFT